MTAYFSCRASTRTPTLSPSPSLLDSGQGSWAAVAPAASSVPASLVAVGMGVLLPVPQVLSCGKVVAKHELGSRGVHN